MEARRHGRRGPGVIGLLALLIAAAPGASQEVHFPDPNLEAAVRDQLGIPAPQPVTEADMLSMVKLVADSRGLTDLHGLECASNVETLLLTQNQVSDLWPISGLTALRHVCVLDNQVASIEPLRNITGLFDLDCSYNQIEDISVVSGFADLWSLTLSHNRISDVSALAGLSQLQSVFLGSNRVSDISALRDLPSLHALNLPGNQIREIPHLSALPALYVLSLSDNQIEDLSGLSGAAGLGALLLDGNAIADISALSGLNRLRIVELGRNSISDISALSGLPDLEWVNLRDNQISDIEPFADLTTLEDLDLRGNPLNELAYTTYLPLIEANNPGIGLFYDPIPEPSCILLLAAAVAVIIGTRPHPGKGPRPKGRRGHLARATGKALFVAVVMALTGPTETALAQLEYAVVDLGTPGEERSYAYALNNAGQVLGIVWLAGGGRANFLWDPAQGMTDLNSLGVQTNQVNGFNDFGQFVYVESAGAGQPAAFLWDGTGQAEYLGRFSTSAVNNAEQVAGYVNDAGPEAVVWDRTEGLRPTGSLPGGDWTVPSGGINARGQAGGVGNTDIPVSGHGKHHSMRTPDVQHHAFLWDAGSGIRDLGTLGEDSAWATDISDSGQLVGVSYTGRGAEYRAFLWDDSGGMRDLGTLPGHEDSEACGISSAGVVIGMSSVFDGDREGFVWESTNGMRSIVDLIPQVTGWSYFCPMDINDAGQILGMSVVVTWGYDDCGVYRRFEKERAVLLTPVPEPGPLATSAWTLAIVMSKGLRRPRRSWRPPGRGDSSQ